MVDVSMPALMESLRHTPTLYWAVAAAALCWGTRFLALRNRSIPSLHISDVSLRKQLWDGLQPFLEELLYACMSSANLTLGAFYWVLDFWHEGQAPSNANYFPVSNPFAKTKEPDLKTVQSADVKDDEQPILHKPRRSAIRRPRTGRNQACECWGFEVEDISPSAGCNSGASTDGDASNESKRSILNCQDDEQGEGNTSARWSECQCHECAMLLMPMKLAVENLFVRTDDTPLGEERCTDSDGQDILTNATNLSTSNPTFTSLSPQIQGRPIENRFIKDRTAVIFIHGLFSSSTFWFDTKLVPNLSNAIKSRHRVLIPDLLGCARSPRPVDSLYTLADQVEAIEKSVIQRHGLQSFHLVAHSMGCTISLVLAARCPERVRSITLIGPVYPPRCLEQNGESSQPPCDAFFSVIEPFTVKGIRALIVSKYYNLSRFVGYFFYSKHKFWVSRIHGWLKRYPKSFIQDYITNYHDAVWHMTHNTLLGGTHAVIPALTKLQERAQRLLVIHGMDDTSCRFWLSEEMSRAFSIVDLCPVPQKGHVDVLWGREREALQLIEKEILSGDAGWSGAASNISC